MTQCVCACFSVDMHTNHSPHSFFLQRRHIETQTRRDWKTLTTESHRVNPTCLKAKGDGTGIHLSALTPTRVNHPACVFADMQQYTYNIKLMYGPFTGGCRCRSHPSIRPHPANPKQPISPFTAGINYRCHFTWLDYSSQHMGQHYCAELLWIYSTALGWTEIHRMALVCPEFVSLPLSNNWAGD